MKKIVILVQQKKAVCFSCDERGTWGRQCINGEPVVDLEPVQGYLSPVLKELSDLLNESTKLNGVHVHVLYDDSDEDILTLLPQVLSELQCSTHKSEKLQPWLQIAQTASRKQPKAPFLNSINDEWLIKTLLPVLNNNPETARQTLKSEEERERQGNIETLRAKLSASNDEVVRLAAQISLLQAQLAQKQAQISSTQFPSMENLLVFLPAIYRNFWGVVRPDELALLAGTLTVPEVASPYTDPSPDTVLVLRRRLLALPESERDCVIGWCRELSHRLEVRMEMRDLLEAD
jgi:hypothetical protein